VREAALELVQVAEEEDGEEEEEVAPHPFLVNGRQNEEVLARLGVLPKLSGVNEVCVCICFCVCICVCVCVCVYVCVCERVHVRCWCALVCACVSMCTYVNKTYAHTCTHYSLSPCHSLSLSHTHTHTHTQRSNARRSHFRSSQSSHSPHWHLQPHINASLQQHHPTYQDS